MNDVLLTYEEATNVDEAQSDSTHTRSNSVWLTQHSLMEMS